MKPKISIITVAYNAEKYIEDTIQSVLAQDISSIEYIIIDGNSTDGTLEICKKYKDQISTILSEPDSGIYDAMNKGVNMASGEVIGILNADDFYANSSVLSAVVDLFKDPKTDCVYGDLVYVDPDDTDKVTRTWQAKTYQKGAFLKGWMPPHPTFFIRKKYYTEFGLYQLNLRSAADYELMLRMIHKHGLNPVYLPQTIVRMRTGGVSNASFKNRLKANKEDRMAWQMNGLKPNAFTFIRKPLSKILQFIKR
ncbi:glycosyltransferase [Putridiphycobacter roseus]|uniref:Glycosyltransferase n=1 Tax=Putridiphycobacter roseus TaxID=2219161 RepID=A0A2W1N140_9FLAO|nr:glycosyltransferase family 2 protein [Putridiphycobacter roseus]PZE17260.1 glycosyltransferase [Putridiphycobacter roseus]